LNGDVGLNGCVECTSYLEMCFELLISFSFQAHVRASNVEALQSSVYAEVEQELLMDATTKGMVEDVDSGDCF